jgi:O-antigen biosynthesis protein
MEWTGERYLPDIDSNIIGAEIHYEHLHRYAFASQFTKGKATLDLASGEGYGSFMLSQEANRVIGIEIDLGAVEHARTKYSKSNLEYRQGSILEIPIEGEKIFDVIVCFEALEHIQDQEKLLLEVKRLLKDNGMFIVSTPNKLEYSDKPGYKNPFHLRELYFDELRDLLSSYFENIYPFGQRVNVGSNIWNLSAERFLVHTEFAVAKIGNSFSFANEVDKSPLYFIIIATNINLEKTPKINSYLIDISNTLIAQRDKHIVDLTNCLQESINCSKTLERAARQTLAERNDQIVTLSEQIEHYKLRASSLEKEIDEMRKSVIWQTTMKFHNGFVERTLPNGTKRREFYDCIIKGGRILFNEGPKSLWLSFQSNIRQKKFLENYKMQSGMEEISPLQILKYMPLISIITPVYNPDPMILNRTILSVIKQNYPNWELCLVDGNSSNIKIHNLLNKFAAEDRRIKVKFSDCNLGISGNSNAALEMAKGEFIALLDHDDELSPNALYEVAKSLNAKNDIDFIYSDEDKISTNGEMCDPFFKPDFSLELLRSENYLSHLVVIRRHLVNSVGGFNSKFDGAQDFDLFLRIVEKGAKVEHIRRILYHWRMSDNSGAQNALAKPWIYELGRTELEQHLARMGLDAKVSIGAGWGLYRTDYSIRDTPVVDIIIPTRKLELFKNCLRSIKKSSYKNYNIYAVINGETDYEIIRINDSSGKDLEKHTDEQTGLIGPQLSYNWSRMNNIAISRTNAPYIITLNDDIQIISENWIENLLRYAQFDHIGTVGCMLLYKDGTIQHAGDFVKPDGTGDHCFNGLKSDSFEVNGLAQVVRECTTVTSACMMIKRDTFQKVGLFDEKLRNFDDYEFGLRLRKNGYINIYTPYVKAYHLESPTRPQVLDPETVAYLLKRIGPVSESFFRYEWLRIYKS